jgi:hypothetical protein
MAKRFTDTDKWKKPFIKSIPAAYKLLWFYITDDCDHAGIWHTDFDVALIRTGVEITEKEAIKIYGDKIVVFDNGMKWFIPSFIEFQYGELKENNRAHESVINILKRYKLIKNKGLTTPLQGCKDKDKDMDMDKDMDKEETAEEISFSKFNDWVKENAPRVSQLKEPITIGQYLKLKADFPSKKITDVLLSMQNRKNLLTAYQSANLTLRNWAKSDFNKTGENIIGTKMVM